MMEVFGAIRKVADSNATVSIRGESGTGKELVARAIHHNSQRRDGPFVGVSCTALPENLIEAELFGHEKGAFTGAVGAVEGRFERAQGGTLFLDEIGTLSLALQAKLLRVLEEREVTRLGGTKSTKVDFRLITATNEDLEQATIEHRFREDLYYRIQVVPISLPPLRERREDIPILIEHFLRRFCEDQGIKPRQIDKEALLYLTNYAWKGNVRELENLIHRLVVMTDAEIIGVTHLPPNVLVQEASLDPHRADTSQKARLTSAGLSLDQEVATYEYELMRAALELAGGVKIKAAELLQLNKDRMKYLCKKYNL
jgi:transcriptional regulator with GAF, ATPase, and Fis domain